MIWHKHLEHRFPDLPAYQQIIMVTNELNRANSQKDNHIEYKACLERALELLDFIIDDSTKWGKKYKELLRARQFLAQRYIESHVYTDTSLLQRTIHQLDPEATKLLMHQKSP